MNQGSNSNKNNNPNPNKKNHIKETAMKKNIKKNTSRKGINIKAFVDTTDLASKIEAICAAATGGAKPLGLKERRRLLRMRTGGQTIMPQLAALAERYGIDGTLPIGTMSDELGKALALAPLAQSLALAATTLSDQIALGESHAWSIATSAYTMLARLAVSDPSLAVELASVRSFFAIGKRPPKATPQEVTPTALKAG
jgi:hypothetical protein